MNYTLLDNGADSLKGAFNSIQAFEETYEGTYHAIKDAVIFLNHGTEILFKLILKKHSAALMFTDLKAYLKAKQQMKKGGQTDVFEVDSSLKTVTLEEAVMRVEYFCDIDIPDPLKAAILYLNKIRNKLMHYGITMNDTEREELIQKLKYCYEELLKFMQDHIDNIEERIEGSRFTITIDDYEAERAEILAEMYSEDARIEYMENAYEDLGEGKW